MRRTSLLVAGALVALALTTVAPWAGSAPRAAGAAATSAGTIVFLGTDREPSGTPGHFVGTGLPAGFRFFDGDLPPGLAAIGVRVTSSADTAGILVTARRAARNDASYVGSFTFATAPSNPLTSTLRVSDRATVTVSYLDARSPSGGPETVTASTTWRRGSAMPDPRELLFSTADPARPRVQGSWRAVAPGATVRAYSTTDSTPVLASAVADVSGAFDLAVGRQVPTPSGAYVTAQEPGEAESARRFVSRASMTGRVVLPEPERQPVLSAFAWVRAPGSPDPCADVSGSCIHGGAITDHDGRWDYEWTSVDVRDPGPYDIDVTAQGVQNEAATPPWKSSAYGNPPTRRASIVDREVTADAGEIALLPPNFVGRAVDSAGFGLNDAIVFVLSPGGGYQPGGGNSRLDGRFALHLRDGDYRLRVLAPSGCAGYGSVDSGVISVRGGVASPSTITFDLGPGSAVDVPGVTVPLVGGGTLDLELGVPGAPVGLTLEDTAGSGSVVAGCGPAVPPPGVLPVGPPVDVDAPGLAFGSVRICLSYSPTDLARAGVTADEVELLHRVGSGFEVITTERRDGRLCGRTASLSPFLLGVPGRGAPAPGGGYWMLGSSGNVYSFGDARHAGSPAPIAAATVTSTVSGNGYWVVSRTGSVYAYGDARYLGGSPALVPGETVSSMSAAPNGSGYWLFTTHGRAFPYGTARHLGDMSGTRLNGPVLGSVATPSGNGYFMVAADGGIFAFGDARFRGSMGSARLNGPVVGLAPDPDGLGYWLVASDGGIFAFDAPFRGSMGGRPLNRPVIGMVAYGDGYLMVAGDGGIFAFSSRPFAGSLGSDPPAHPIVAVAPLPG